MKNYIAVQSSTGDIYSLKANNTEDAYRKFGKEILGMGEDLDTGDVDIDLYDVTEMKSDVTKLELI